MINQKHGKRIRAKITTGLKKPAIEKAIVRYLHSESSEQSYQDYVDLLNDKFSRVWEKSPSERSRSTDKEGRIVGRIVRRVRETPFVIQSGEKKLSSE